ncbi:MAG: HAMP domain-containing sensor histidine kinase [Candidatus Pseudobacter hemicellulosilyticus]|uniref:histidine kinase n=1 Tax=Candidatus Pseudobacter hemicellulosilyticus TaxID=3121375 RepID=A0AAJ5WQ01_9BACT|nr:MAG: HAMP domain-containing sensor histidine kinase [Pseudobacter sp.]
MNSLRIRFVTGFSALFTIALALTLSIVYFLNANLRKEEYFKRLKNKADNSFRLLVTVPQVDSTLLQIIERNTATTLDAVSVTVYRGNQVIYTNGPADRPYQDSLLPLARQEGDLYTSHQHKEVVALYRRHAQQDYTVIAAAFDSYGKNNLYLLRWVLAIVFGVGILLGWIATLFFVRKIIRPLDELKGDLQLINSASLHTRLKVGSRSEEVDSLAASFNQMMDRIEEAFSLQKDFVHYASHELRTPITAQISLTEIALEKDLSPEQSHEVLQQLYQQQQQLATITHSLLLLTDKQPVDETYPLVRLDELVIRAVEFVQTLYPSARIEVTLDVSSSNEAALMIRANEPLLIMAFNNLLKNAVQYSDNNAAIVILKIKPGSREVIFRNTGEIFSPDEQARIYTPFYRASNARRTKGHGLGLALVKQIADIHKAEIKYQYDGLNIFSFCFTDEQGGSCD